jgi:hypothetical protein
MRLLTAAFVILCAAREGYMSGRVDQQDFASRLNQQSHVYAVRILSVSSMVVKELAAVDSAMGHQHCYVARITAVLQRGGDSSDEPESWTFKLSPADKRIVDDARTRGAQGLTVGDTIVIMNAESIEYSIVYYVEGRHKIFLYARCEELAEGTEPGADYLFVSSGWHSRASGVFYGNFADGLYPDTPRMRARVKSLLKEQANPR